MASGTFYHSGNRWNVLYVGKNIQLFWSFKPWLGEARATPIQRMELERLKDKLNSTERSLKVDKYNHTNIGIWMDMESEIKKMSLLCLGEKTPWIKVNPLTYLGEHISTKKLNIHSTRVGEKTPSRIWGNKSQQISLKF